jgi:hypothetical protein
MFLSADFWPLFWAVIAGGAGLTALLSLFVATVGQPRHAQAPAPVELPAHPAPARPEPAQTRRAA